MPHGALPFHGRLGLRLALAGAAVGLPIANRRPLCNGISNGSAADGCDIAMPVRRRPNEQRWERRVVGGESGGSISRNRTRRSAHLPDLTTVGFLAAIPAGAALDAAIGKISQAVGTPSIKPRSAVHDTVVPFLFPAQEGYRIPMLFLMVGHDVLPSSGESAPNGFGSSLS